MITDGGEDARLLELLYLAPVAMLKYDGTGAIDLMNPLAVQILMPIAPDGRLENAFALFGKTAPELQEMATRFEPRVGRVCDEHRVLAVTGGGGATRTIALSVTIQKVHSDGFVAVIADVTAAAFREELLRANETRLRAAIDSVRDYGICTVDASGRVTSWNRSAERLDGYRTDEIVGISADVLLAAPGALGTFAAAFTRARQNGFHEYEGWRVRKNGTRYWASTAIAVLHEQTDDESIIGYSIVTRDITLEKRAREELQTLAITDPLTGALNRRGLFTAALREESRARESGTGMSLLMMDIDRFKDINDRYGHSAGDAILKHVFLRAQAEIRSIDVIGRYGGEEFCIVLPGSTRAGAVAVAERIRAKIAAAPVDLPNASISVSVSIGVADTSGGVTDVANLIRVADEAMYVAKREGRNRVSTLGGAPAGSPGQTPPS